MASFFEKLYDAKKEFENRTTNYYDYGLEIYNLKKVFPKRKRKYFVGSYIEYLNIG